MYQKQYNGNISFYCYDPVIHEMILTFSYKNTEPYSVVFSNVSDKDAGIMLGKLNRNENPESFLFILNERYPEFHSLPYVLNEISEDCLDDTPENEELNSFLKYAEKDIEDVNSFELSDVSLQPIHKMFHMKQTTVKKQGKSLYDISVYVRNREDEQKILPCFVLADDVIEALNRIKERVKEGLFPMIPVNSAIDVYSVRKIAETEFNRNIPVVIL